MLENDDKKEQKHYLTYTVTEEEEGETVRALLYEKLELSTRKIRALKRISGGILLDGHLVTVRETVKGGQSLQILLDDHCPSASGTDFRTASDMFSVPGSEKSSRILPAEMSLSILYEDADLLFMNKPPGIACHPSRGHLTDTLCNGVSGYFMKSGQNASIHLFGRLDKDTSGVIGISKNKVMAERMHTKRQTGGLQKEYLALVHGCPPASAGTITIPMAEDRSGGYLRMRAGTEAEAKRAITHYEVLRVLSENRALSDRFRHESGQDLCRKAGLAAKTGAVARTEGSAVVSLCRITIETGRTHQIRFHMAAIGCPLVGDSLYGVPLENEGTGTGKFYEKGSRKKEEGLWPETCCHRAALHAWRVRFCHPFTGQEIVLTAGLPEDMRKILVTAREEEKKDASTGN